MESEPELTPDFCCVKCRNHQAATRTANLFSGLAHILSPGSDKYLLVTCTLCGYTEIYDLRVYADNQALAFEAKKAAAALNDA